MNITDRARDLLDDILHEQKGSCIRVYFAGYEQGEPQLGVTFADPEADDELTNINEIPVAIDQRIIHLTENLTLDGQPSPDGPEFSWK
ncbi:hypothetical protein [Thalassobacillus pellis]|uniref:hypothetical protein n=1 Tax=Thalassobacillus pellis TaxID=748008 RepID=UPI00195F357B|nr:hypothetical protein [Thalassobacillus pellis]MBM7554337.1 Fe-S cluster assembly iron-binding protein IscA [Thalassobacillus pellis]